jgi:glycosyltransferase involved in cell wall biosynthesis
MKVNLIFRNHGAGFSIYNVFKDFFSNKKGVILLHSFVTERYANIISILKNLKYVISLRKSADIFHITGDVHYCVLALIFKKKILTIHDIVLLDRTPRGLKYFFYWIFWFYLPCKLVNHVVCISETTKENLNRYVKPKYCSVIYNPVSPMFKLSLKDFNSDLPVILHIGTGWNKNLQNVIKALNGIQCKLRIIGSVQDQDIYLLKYNNINYSLAMDLSNKEIVEEYNNCDIVSFPSVYEGFGLPIVEGQAVGRVVLTSSINPMLEIGSDGAYYVNPYDIDNIKAGFIELITNKILRDELIQKGIENCKRFTLSKIMGEYINLYQNCF